jgi:hypothetical protein
MTLFEKFFIKNHAFLIFLIGKPFHKNAVFPIKLGFIATFLTLYTIVP